MCRLHLKSATRRYELSDGSTVTENIPKKWENYPARHIVPKTRHTTVMLNECKQLKCTVGVSRHTTVKCWLWIQMVSDTNYHHKTGWESLLWCRRLLCGFLRPSSPLSLLHSHTGAAHPCLSLSLSLSFSLSLFPPHISYYYYRRKRNAMITICIISLHYVNSSNSLTLQFHSFTQQNGMVMALLDAVTLEMKKTK